MGTWIDATWPSNPSGQTRREKMGGRYQAWLPGQLAEAEWPISSETLVLLKHAERSLGVLQRARVSDVAALAHLLLRVEAVSSSWIEDIAIRHKRLAAAEFESNSKDHAALEVVGNVKALELSVGKLANATKLAVADIENIHKLLMLNSPTPEIAGHIRTTQNWIGGNAYSPIGAAYVPPPPDAIKPLLEDLVAYINRDDQNPIIQAALAHAQFETIHPFLDGNGRTGRTLISMILKRRGLVPNLSPPVSLALTKNLSGYIRGLEAYRRGDTSTWINFFSKTVDQASWQALKLGGLLLAREAKWLNPLGEPPASSIEHRIITALPAYPVLDLGSVRDRYQASDEAARLALNSLESHQVIKQFTTKSRNRVWGATDIFKTLDSFEENIRLAESKATEVEADGGVEL